MLRSPIPTLAAVLWVCLAVLAGGCVSTARFRLHHEEPKDAPPQYAKEIHEEIAEDDRMVNPESVMPMIESSAVESDRERSSIVHEITNLLGTPYNYSGVDNRGIDCSGFTAKVFQSLGKSLPHSTAEQYRMSAPVAIGKEKLGDLVFFNTTGESPSHVGIYLGGGYFAHASVSTGVTISTLESSYYRLRYVATRRLRK